MSRSSNNFPPPPPWIWQPGQSYGDQTMNYGDWNRPLLQRPPFGFQQDDNFRHDIMTPMGASLDPGRSIQDRSPTGPGPLGFTSFPVPPPLPSIPSRRILVIRSEMMTRETMNTRPRAPIPHPLPPPLPPPPRFDGPWETLDRENPSSSSWLSPDEQKAALQKLRKVIYKPSSKRLPKRVSLYYRNNSSTDNNNNNNNNNEREDEDEKRCAVCLDDLEAEELVLITPCSHMFHEDCIVPWVKSHGQCPVCRFAICERRGERGGGTANNDVVDVASANNPFAENLVSIIRSMEEAFDWSNGRVHLY